ncbi:hypothetical protein PG990_013076 [Apiospora arundinis]
MANVRGLDTTGTRAIIRSEFINFVVGAKSGSIRKRIGISSCFGMSKWLRSKRRFCRCLAIEYRSTFCSGMRPHGNVLIRHFDRDWDSAFPRFISRFWVGIFSVAGRSGRRACA